MGLNLFIIYIIFSLINFTQQYDEEFTKIKDYQKLDTSYKLFLKGDLLEAAQQFERKKNSTANYNAAYLYFLSKKSETSFDLANNVIKDEDADTEIKAWSYYILSQIYKEKKDNLNELIYLKKAIDESNDFGEFYFKLGDYYLRVGDKSSALDTYKDGLDLNELSTEYHLKVAKIYEEEDVEKALDYLSDLGGEVYPEGEFLPYYARLYKRLKKKKNAIKKLNKYLELYPEGYHKQKVVNELAQMSIVVNHPVFNDKKNTEKYSIRFGEKLVYGVSYLFKLGEMTISVDPEPVMRNGIKTARVTYTLQSGTIGLDSKFEVYIDLETLNSVESILLKKTDNIIPEIKTYVFKQKENKFVARVVKENGRISYVEKEMPYATQDGTGILYYARGLVANKKSMSVTTVIDEEFKLTDIFVRDYLDEEEALGVEDNYFYIDAKAHYKGVAGMNGEARGWFSVDGEYTPLVGKMSIIIGSVRVELDERK